MGVCVCAIGHMRPTLSALWRFTLSPLAKAFVGDAGVLQVCLQLANERCWRRSVAPPKGLLHLLCTQRTERVLLLLLLLLLLLPVCSVLISAVFFSLAVLLSLHFSIVMVINPIVPVVPVVSVMLHVTQVLVITGNRRARGCGRRDNPTGAGVDAQRFCQMPPPLRPRGALWEGLSAGGWRLRGCAVPGNNLVKQ